jgi:hypothetical protein
MNEASSMAASVGIAPQSQEKGQPGALTAMLGRIESELETGIAFESPLLARLRILRCRLEHKRLQLAVLGQFKRGKSTIG